MGSLSSHLHTLAKGALEGGASGLGSVPTHTHTPPGTPASPRAAQGSGGDRFAWCPVGLAGKHLPGLLASGEGDAVLLAPHCPQALCLS